MCSENTKFKGDSPWTRNIQISGLALLSFAVGWLGHVLYGMRDTDATAATTHPACTKTDEVRLAGSQAIRDRHCPTTVASLASCDHDCESKLEATQRELALALDKVYECHADEIPWPDDIGAEWRSTGFENALAAVLQEAGVTGDVTFHCEEFPCIARLPDSSDRYAIEEALGKYYSETYGTTAEIYVKGHGSVGAWGNRALRFIAAMPADLSDDYVQERVSDRLDDLIQAINKDLASEAKTQEHLVE